MRKRKLTALLLSGAMLLSLAATPVMAAEPETDDKPVFEDTADHWGKASAERWAAVGVLKGNDKGEFLPDKEMTRAEFAQMLVNLMGYTEKAENVFSDVKATDWYADAILKLAAAGVMQGSEGRAMPEDPISREQAAVLLCRALKLSPSKDAKADLTGVSDWAKDAMTALVERKMMNGDEKGDLMPAVNINRASVAQLVDNMVSAYVTEPGATVTGTQEGIVIVAAKDVTIQDATLKETVIVAPAAAEATVTLAGKTSAGDVVVDAEGAKVVVEKTAEAGTVTVAADKASAEIAGKADAVTVTGSEAAVTVTAGAAVTDVTVEGEKVAVTVAGKVTNVTVAESAADTGVTVAKGATVGTVTADSAVAVENNGTIQKVEANESGVTIDGNAPQKIETAEGVTAPTDSKGETVTEKPASSGGSSGSSGSTPSHTYDVTVTVNDSVGGTSTKTNVQQDEKTGEGVTDKYEAVTITPKANAQNGNTLPYIVKEVKLTTKPADSKAEITEANGVYTFTPDVKGNYVVDVTYVQPLKTAELFIVNDQASFDKLKSFGYSEGETQTTYVPDLATMQWIAVGLVRAEGYDGDDDKITDGKLTANDADVEKASGWPGSIGKYSAAYVNKNTRGEDTSGTAFELDGAAYKFKLTFKFKGAEYTLTTDYKKINPETGEPVATKTVTFKENANNTVVASYDLAEGEKVKVPTPASVDGYYFTGWDTEGITSGSDFTMGTEDVTITAQYTQIKSQPVAVRPGPGPAQPSGDEKFDYGGAYQAAGITLSGTTYTVDGQMLFTYATGEDTKTAFGDLCHEINNTNYVFYGLQFAKPDTSVKKVVYANSLANLDDSNSSHTFDLTQDITNDAGDVYEGELVDYFPTVSEKDGVLTFGKDATFEVWFKWLDENEAVKAVTHATISRKTVNLPKVTVKYMDGKKELKTEQVTYNSADWTLFTAPEKNGYTFKNWKNGDTAYSAASALTKDLTLTAEYEATAYNITYQGIEGAQNAQGNPSTYTIVTEEITLQAATGKAGFTFDKWVDEDGKAVETIAQGSTGDITLTAIWTVNSETTFKTMSSEVYDLYAAQGSGFNEGIPQLAEFSTNVTFEVSKDDPTKITVKGTLLPVTKPEYADFNQSNATEQTGYYLVFEFEAPDDAAKVEGKIVWDAKKEFTASNLDKVGGKQVFSFIYWIAEPVYNEDTGCTSTITLNIDWDGTAQDGKDATAYTLDLTGLTMQKAEQASTDQPGQPEESGR